MGLVDDDDVVLAEDCVFAHQVECVQMSVNHHHVGLK